MKPETKHSFTPNLRFPEFREEGEWKKHFGNKIFDQINNKQHDSSLPVLAITQEHGAIPRDAIDYQVSVTKKSLESYKVVEVGDFIISLRSFQGGIEYSSYKGICSPAYIILRKKNDVSEAFFKQFFKTDRFIQQLQKNLEGLRDGKMVSYKQFSELLLPTPSIGEQQKIADCLSSLDELITTQNQKLDTLKNHKTGLMQQLFPVEGETLPQLRFPEFQNAPEWAEKQFGEICKFTRGPFGGALKKEIFVKDGYAVYEQSHAIHKKFDSFRYYITEEKFNELKRFSVLPDDIIMSCSGTMGKFAIIPRESKKGVINQALLKLTVRKEFDLRFIKATLELPSNQEKLLSQSAGGAIKNVVSVGQIKEIDLYIPKLEEQQKIADCLSSLNEQITAQTEKIDALNAHKKGLMQQLFPSPDEAHG